MVPPPSACKSAILTSSPNFSPFRVLRPPFPAIPAGLLDQELPILGFIGITLQSLVWPFLKEEEFENHLLTSFDKSNSTLNRVVIGVVIANQQENLNSLTDLPLFGKTLDIGTSA